MSKKITKVIAGLGVVAGLGIAALPLSSYAATNNLDVEVTVGEIFTITTDPLVASCVDGSDVPMVNYGKVELSFSSPISVQTDDSGICVQSNKTGTYNLSVGTRPDATIITTALYSENIVGSGEATATDVQKIPASATITGGVAGWGYKFTGATNAGSAVSTAIEADTAYVAPTQFASGHASGGRTLSADSVIPNTKGDYYGITIGAAISGNHTGTYIGGLQFYAVAE